METMTETRRKSQAITRLMISIHIFMTCLCVLLMIPFTGSLFVSIPLGIIVWALVLFKTPVFDWTFINVKQNFTVLLGNQLKHNVIPDEKNKRIKFDEFEYVSMREVGAGIQGKFPWEVPFESVDLQSEYVIGKNEPLLCYTKDNIPLEIQWQCILTPLQGCLINMIRKGDDASKNFFIGQFSQKIISWIKEKNEEDIPAILQDLNPVFKGTFSGPNEVHPNEEEYGLFTNTPQIISVTRSKRFQSAAEAEMIAEKIQSISKSINDGFADQEAKPDPNMVLAAANSAAGVEISGLVLIPGLSGDKAGIMAAVGKIADQTKGKKGGK